ncbi:MAG: TetR family transcriptional regulator [Tissierellia bacterium]|nr:TetR family transcriptional regulator [Tissierellia bacterium]
MSNLDITKMALANAMKQLMIEKPMGEIIISDITKLCNMNRKSFYYHFKDKYDLVNWIFYTEFVSAIQETSPNNIWDFLESICIYLNVNKTFYCNALKVKGQNSFSEYFTELLEPIILTHFDDIFSNIKYKEFFSTFFADAIRTAISRWLIEGNDISPSKFIELTRSAIEGIAFKVIEDIDE